MSRPHPFVDSAASGSKVNLRVAHTQYVVGHGAPSTTFAPGVSVKAGDVVERRLIDDAQQPHLGEWLARGWLRPSERELQLVPGVNLTVGDNLLDARWLQGLPAGYRDQLQEWIGFGWVERIEVTS